jgi:hypothetical protein
MKPIHVAVIIKDRPGTRERERRNMGMWSYAVDSFTWDFIAPGKGTTISTRDLKAKGFDLIFHEDGGAWAEYSGRAIPVVFYSIDSTLSEEYHFRPRFAQACQADLVLVDHDRLERFEPSGRPVRRLLYCVNDRLFYPREKTLDVDFQCGGTPERARLRVQLSELCKAHGWSYRSGVAPLEDYAAAMGAAKVVVVLPRTPRNRPHRVYDAMACGAAVLSAPLPDIQEERLFAGRDYTPLSEDLDTQLAAVLGWMPHLVSAGNGFIQQHTWSTRARELRTLLAKELGL